MFTPRIHIFDRPGGDEITEKDIGVVARSLQWTAKLPGGDATASFELSRDGLISWPDIRPGAYMEIKDHGMVLWAGRLQIPQGSNQGTVQIKALGLFQSHLKDQSVTEPTNTTEQTPGQAVQNVAQQYAPDLVIRPDLIDDHDSFTIRLSRNVYVNINPWQLFLHLSRLGDATGRRWDVYCRGRELIYRPRLRAAATYTLPKFAGVIQLSPDESLLANDITVEYRADDGAVLVFNSQDQASIDQFGQRVKVLREWELTDAQARALAATHLADSSQRWNRYQITTGVLFDANGVPLPATHARVGETISVNGSAPMVIEEITVDADGGTVQIVPEHGVKTTDPVAVINDTASKATSVYYGTGSGYAGVPENRDVARNQHGDNHYLGQNDVLNAPSLGGVGGSSGQVPVNSGATMSNLNADLIDGQHASAFAPAGNYQPAGNYIQSGQNANLGTITAIGLDVGNRTVTAGRIALGSGTLVLGGQTQISGNLGVGGAPQSGKGISVYSGEVAAPSFRGSSFQNNDGSLWKNAIIHEQDGSYTRFVCREGERARFEVLVPLASWERWLPSGLRWRVIKQRLSWRYLANVQPPYWVVIREQFEPHGWVAEVVADVRDDAPYQVPRAFGDPAHGPRADEPYGCWEKTA